MPDPPTPLARGGACPAMAAARVAVQRPLAALPALPPARGRPRDPALGLRRSGGGGALPARARGEAPPGQRLGPDRQGALGHPRPVGGERPPLSAAAIPRGA